MVFILGALEPSCELTIRWRQFFSTAGRRRRVRRPDRAAATCASPPTSGLAGAAVRPVDYVFL